MIAIKSFLRFYDNVAIVAHDDGSLTKKDMSLLGQHIKGIRIISKKAADGQMKEILKPFVNTKRYRDSMIQFFAITGFCFACPSP